MPKRKVVDKYEIYVIGSHKVMHLQNMKANLEKQLEAVIKKLEILCAEMDELIDD